MNRQAPRSRNTLLLAMTLLAFPVPGYCVLKTTEKALAEIRPDKATVYFFRVPSWGKGVESLLYVFSGEHFAGLLPKNSYTVAYLDPGTQTLWNSAAVREKGSADLTSTRELEFQAGKEYYVVLNYRVPPNVFFSVVEPEEGRGLITQARFQATVEDSDLATAKAFREERFAWLEEVKARRQEPGAVIWRMSEDERDRVLCDIRRIYVDKMKISASGTGSTVAEAKDFRKALRKKLKPLHFEAASTRENADAVLTGVVDKVRTETPRSYKNVSSAHVILQTLEGQEIWTVDVDNSRPDVTTTMFNTWSQLARRALARLRDECRDKR